MKDKRNFLAKKTGLWALLLAFLWLSGCVDGIIEPESPYDFSAVDTLLQNSLDRFQGHVVMVVWQNGRQIYGNALGDFTTRTLLSAASGSKGVSAAVILSLADQGLLHLDDSIGSYLPIFKQYGKGDITIRQCFTMTSGFEECRAGSLVCAVTDTSITLEEAVNRIAKTQPLVYKPGTTVYYSGIGMHIAGRIAEIVSGKSWHQLVAERITGPCHMPSSTFGDASENAYIAGGLRTTAADYLNFLQMLLDNGYFGNRRVLSAEAVQTYFTPQATNARLVENPYPTPPPFYPYDEAPTVRYGFGAWQDVVNPMTEEVERISIPGAFGMFPWVDRKRNLVGIIMTQSTLEATIRTELKLIKRVRDAIDQTGE